MLLGVVALGPDRAVEATDLTVAEARGWVAGEDCPAPAQPATKMAVNAAVQAEPLMLNLAASERNECPAPE